MAQTTRTLVLKIEHSSRSNHNGGDLHFGPEGLLYATTGDGGGANDPDNNGQTLIRTGTADQQSTALLGKLLRIAPGASGGYTVPPDNPFVGRLDARGEIFAYGLRNPFRFSFDRGTGNLLIGDVGQDDAEEVNFSATRGRGANFGWKCYEGTLPNDGTTPPCEPPGHVPPVFEYDRSGCQAITGGYVVRNAGLPGLVGRYLYADYCVGDIRSIVPSTGAGDTSTGIDVAGLLARGLRRGRVRANLRRAEHRAGVASHRRDGESVRQRPRRAGGHLRPRRLGHAAERRGAGRARQRHRRGESRSASAARATAR